MKINLILLTIIIAIKLNAQNHTEKWDFYFCQVDYDFGIKENDNWDTYLNFLYPSRRDYQSILNRRVLTQLENSGDKLTELREVDHWVYFKTEIDRKNFEEEVIKRGFQIRDKDFNNGYGENPYRLVVSRKDKVGWGEIDEYTIELWELANQFNGDYDGWECPMITEKKE